MDQQVTGKLPELKQIQQQYLRYFGSSGLNIPVRQGAAAGKQAAAATISTDDQALDA
jgi:hypothetical protein